MADDEAEIRRLLAQYCQLLDDGSFDEWIELFSDDIEFVVMGMHKHGRDALRNFVEPNQQAEARGKHMLSEPQIVIDGDSASASTDFVWVSKLGNHRPEWSLPRRDRPGIAKVGGSSVEKSSSPEIAPYDQPRQCRPKQCRSRHCR